MSTAAEVLTALRDLANIKQLERGELHELLEDGILAGITRSAILQRAEHLGIEVSYRSLPREQIYDVEELFLTSSIREVMPIVQVDGRPIGAGTPGKTTQRLHRAFREHVGLGARLPFEAGEASS